MTTVVTELHAIFRAAGRALGVRVALTMFFAGLCAGSSFLLIPIPFALLFLGAATAFARGRDLGGDYERTLGAGALAAIGLLPFLGSLLIGEMFLASFDERTDWAGPAVAIQVGAATLGTMAVSPLLAAADQRASAVETIGESLARSIAIAARRPLATMLVGALQGVLFSLPVVAFVTAEVPTSLVLALVGCGIAWTIYPTLACGLSTPSTGAPRAIGWLLAPTALAWIGLLAIGAAISSPLHERWSRPARSDEARSEVRLTPVGAHGFELTTPAATTYVRSSHDRLGGRGTTWRDEATGHVIACMSVSRTECIGTELDARYERVDDDVLGRWRARIGATHLAMLGVALALLAWAFVRARRAARSVVPGEATRVVLRLGPDATHLVEDEHLVPRGDVRLESLDGDRVVTLDRPLPIVLSDWATREGAELTLVTSRPITGLGPRVGASSLPEDAWLAAGLDAASARILRIARASAVLATLAVLLALLGAALPLLSL